MIPAVMNAAEIALNQVAISLRISLRAALFI
jgi:hypothetical protein